MKFAAAILAIALSSALAHAAETAAAGEAALEMPQSLRVEHDELIARLSSVAEKKGKEAQAARAALDLLKPHFAKQEQYVFRPLGLLPALAEGHVTSDMKDAVAMGERVKAESDQLFDEHIRITGAMTALIAAAEGEHDEALVAIARQAALHSLDEVEVLQPAAVLVGEYVKAKLASDGKR